MELSRYVLGIDFGTDSVRAVVVNANSGVEEANQVVQYHRWAEGRYCDPATNQFRQHPRDYIESLESAVQGVLAQLSAEIAEHIVGIGVDTTGSTPCAVDQHGTPLALRKEFQDNPNAMFLLWKDHTAIQEAEGLNEVARTWGGVNFTRYEGGVYSSEWFWAKILHVLRIDEAVRQAAFSWVEHCDWMPALLTGQSDPLTWKRSRCAAGHKAMWHASWDGLPHEDYLVRIDPLLKGLRKRLYTNTYTSDVKAGGLCDEWAQRLGLQPGTAVAVGALDAHFGAVGAGIKPGVLSKIMGTSTCDMLVTPPEVLENTLVPGICGQVDGSVVPGMIGLEAGQSAFGDVYAWFKDLLSWPLESLLADTTLLDVETAERVKREWKQKLLDHLAQAAAKISPDQSSILALDWLNGRRTPFADQALKGAILGLTLGTSAPMIFRALVEATAFGARSINEQFQASGIEIREVVATGGIAQKSPFVMQVTADVLNMPIKVVSSEQAAALGGAMFGAVVAGIYPDVAEAQAKMSSGFSTTYRPDAARAAHYDKLYHTYQEVGKALETYLQAL